MSTSITAAGSGQFVCWFDAEGSFKSQPVLVWTLEEGRVFPKAIIWCCDGMQNGVPHAMQKHGATKHWVGDIPR